MSSKVSSLEEKVKLPPTDTISRCYQPQSNRKVIRILTVAVYVLCVSLAAIMLSLYYIFIWDPTIRRPFTTKGTNCEKIVIPEKIAIRLLNTSEVSAEQFYRHILEQYRILHQLQVQRKQFLQNQHIKLQQLAAVGKFQEVFATATIIQSNRNNPYKKPITPTNGTYLLGRLTTMATTRTFPPTTTSTTTTSTTTTTTTTEAPFLAGDLDSVIQQGRLPILNAGLPSGHIRRKPHRKHSGSNHHNRHSSRNSKMRKKSSAASTAVTMTTLTNNQAAVVMGDQFIKTPALNPPATIIREPYTQMPIPLILNSREDIKRVHHSHNHGHGDRARQDKIGRKRTLATSVSGYESAPSYLNPFITGELIFEK